MVDFKDAILIYTKGSHKKVCWTCPKCNQKFIKPFKQALKAKLCKPCNNIVRPKPDYSGINNPFYGKTHSNEFKSKISKSGNPNWKGGMTTKCLTCGILLSEKRVNYCVKHFQTGSLNHMWIDGLAQERRDILRNTPEYRDWAKAVKLRDNFTCQKCNIKGGTLHSHHILKFSQYPELRYEVSNGITLCKCCHQLEHTKT